MRSPGDFSTSVPYFVFTPDMAPPLPPGGYCDGGGFRSVDSELDVLSHWLHRVIIRFCADRSRELVDVDELADFAYETQREFGKEMSRENILIELYHARLPQLDEEGVVDFAYGDSTLRYHSDEKLETLIEKIEADE